MNINIPASFTAGDTFSATVSLPDYLASGGWSASLILINASAKMVVNSSALGDEHRLAETAANTAAWSAGQFQWILFVDDGTDRHQVADGFITVAPDPVASATSDNRSHAQKMVDAIEALLEKRATDSDLDLVSFSVAGRQKARDPAVLAPLLDKYRAQVRAEKHASAIANGGVGKNRITVRF